MGLPSNTNDFIQKATLKHNGKYNYDKVDYKGTFNKVCIICPEHGEFWQTPNAHLQGRGCPECRYIKASKTKTKTKDLFLQQAKKVHGNKYDYSNVDYNGTENKVCIICPKHGEFWQTPHHHLAGRGCPICGAKKYSTEEFIQRAQEKHGDNYDYSKTIFTDKKHKVIITCPIHGDFEQLPLNHLAGRGCPICGSKRNKTERIVYDILKNKYQDVIFQYTSPIFKGKKKNQYLDFFLPNYNIGIELQGIEHFTIVPYFGGQEYFTKIQERDRKKQKICKNNGITLLYLGLNKDVPGTFLGQKVYNSMEELYEAIDNVKNNLISINENDIKELVLNIIRKLLTD